MNRFEDLFEEQENTEDTGETIMEHNQDLSVSPYPEADIQSLENSSVHGCQ